MTDIEDIRPTPKAALLTEAEYTDLNNIISELEGFETGKHTVRMFSVNPEKAKVNIQYDDEGNETDYDTKCIATISSQLQIKYPDLFEGMELINPWEIKKEEQWDEL